MAAVVPLTAFEAIQNEIRALCLQDFPCGTGSWRDTCDLLKAIQKGQLKHRSHERKFDFSQLDAHMLENRKSEELLDLISSPISPWYLDCNWSNEAKDLREIAVKSPWKINPDFVYSYFRTLKIVDKSVTEVDDRLLRLKNLEELTLSANYITNINSRYLPPSLKVLELYANNISDISDLCNMPPSLHHLGLGRNNISFVGDYISGQYWPNLASLDMSFNNLCDLAGIVLTLCTLSKLRSLNLQGNPISLAPAYRGYIIDCLYNLFILDDKHISADEKHHSKDFAKKKRVEDAGLARFHLTMVSANHNCLPASGLITHRKIKILDYACLIALALGHGRHMTQYPEDQPEFPVIERSYFVQFMFPEKLFKVAEEAEIHHMDNVADGSVVGPQTEENEATVRSPQSVEGHEQINPEKNLAADGDSQRKNDVKTPENKDVGREEVEVPPHMNLVSVNSPFYQWDEEIKLDWKTDLSMSDLVVLRDLFAAGVDFNVVEQIVESFLMETETKTEKSGDAKLKDKKKEKAESIPESNTEKNEDVKGKDKKKDKEQEKGKGKKKRQEYEELVQSPPYFNNIATFHASLDCFLNGVYSYEETFTIALNKQSADKFKGKKKASIKQQERKKGASKNAKDKDVEKISNKELSAVEEDEELPLLLVNVTVKLQHWLMALDSLKESKQNSWLKKIETVLQ